jgi:tRNA(adenine34) deaminase
MGHGALIAEDARISESCGRKMTKEIEPVSIWPMIADPMGRALEEARKAGARGEVPVGAVLVKDGRLIAAAGNETRARHDPTAHAEILVLRAACAALQQERLQDHDLYVTLEPCTLCAAAISFARIRRLYYGAPDPKGGGVMQGARFFTQPTCHHAPDVYDGLRESEAAALLRDFFADKR